jgi:hypothetical protein
MKDDPLNMAAASTESSSFGFFRLVDNEFA